MFRIFAPFFLIALATGALAWQEPARGTQTRQALMDAIRPHAEWTLGEPVQFVVHDLRVSGALAFASLWPQRPGGQEIDLRSTPAYFRGELDVEFMDNVAMQALYRRSGQTWVAVQWSIGATDVWWSDPVLCAAWRPVIAEVCEGL